MLEKLEYKGFESTPTLDSEGGSTHGTVDGCDAARVHPGPKTPAAP